MARSANPTSNQASPTPRRRRASSVFGEIDPRLANMSQTTLVCRGTGHVAPWVPPGPKRRAELAVVGQVELRRTCINCGYTRVVVYDARERVVVEQRTEYPEGYLLAPEHRGTGRVSRWDAYVALQ